MTTGDTSGTIIVGDGSKKEYEKGILSFCDVEREIKILWTTDLLIGRDEICDIKLDNKRISRKHAMVILEYDAAKLNDLSSANGTTRNGEAVNDTIILNDGDKLVLGGAVEIDVCLREEDETVKTILLKLGTKEYLLTQTEVLIGRHPVGTDIHIDDVTVGSIHAQLEFVFDDAIITSLDDEKEMTIDGAATRSVQLKRYSEIKLGNTKLTWRF